MEKRKHGGGFERGHVGVATGHSFRFGDAFDAGQDSRARFRDAGTNVELEFRMAGND